MSTRPFPWVPNFSLKIILTAVYGSDTTNQKKHSAHLEHVSEMKHKVSAQTTKYDLTRQLITSCF